MNTTGAGGLHHIVVGNGGAAHSRPPLSVLEILGIGLGALALLALVIVLAVCLARWVKRRKKAADARAPWSPPPRPPRRQAAPPDVRAGAADSCRLCKTDYDVEAGQGPFAVDCGHAFHRRCIRRWLQVNSTCPVCNNTVYALLRQIEVKEAAAIMSPGSFSESTRRILDPSTPAPRRRTFTL